jgi:predicted nuclease with TOPRIM domain
VKFVRLIRDAGMGEDQVINLFEIWKDIPRVISQYEKLKAEINPLENEKSNLAKECQRLSDDISNLCRTEN